MFKLVRKTNPNEIHKLSLKEFIEFGNKHPISLYDISTKEVSIGYEKFKSGEKELLEYKKSLNFGQINDIELGQKEIRFNSKIGFYLVRIVNTKESFFSHSMHSKDFTINKTITEPEELYKIIDTLAEKCEGNFQIEIKVKFL